MGDLGALTFYGKMADTSRSFPQKYFPQIPSFGVMEDAIKLVHM